MQTSGTQTEHEHAETSTMCSKGIHTAVDLHIFITIFHSMEYDHHHILIPVAYQNFHLLLAITQFFLQVKFSL